MSKFRCDYIYFGDYKMPVSEDEDAGLDSLIEAIHMYRNKEISSTELLASLACTQQIVKNTETIRNSREKIYKELIHNFITLRQYIYVCRFRMAEDAIHSLLIAKEHLNNIKTNIIADNYYCNTINTEPFQSGFNPVNYRFNNPNYQQPAMDVPSFGGPVFPSVPSNTGFNPNATKHYYQNVYSEDSQETKIEQSTVSNATEQQ